MRCFSRSAILLALLSLTLTGCGGDDPFATSGGESSESASDSETARNPTPAKAETSWQLIDDSNLEVSLDPPGASEATLRARRAFGIGAEAAPLRQLHYRIVTEQDSDAAWTAFPEPKREDAGHDVYWNNYAAKVTLPQGRVFVQFKIDHGGMEPYELTDWSVEVK